MNDPEGSNFATYIINERDRRQSQDPRRASRVSNRRISSPGKRSLKDTPNLDPNQDKGLQESKPIKIAQQIDVKETHDDKNETAQKSISNTELSTLEATILDINPTKDADNRVENKELGKSEEPVKQEKKSVDKTEEEMPRKERASEVGKRTLDDILYQQNYVRRSQQSDSRRVSNDVKTTKKKFLLEEPILEDQLREVRKSRDSSVRSKEPEIIFETTNTSQDINAPVSPDVAKLTKPELPENATQQHLHRLSDQRKSSLGNQTIAERQNEVERELKKDGNKIPKKYSFQSPSFTITESIRSRLRDRSEEEEMLQKVVDKLSDTEESEENRMDISKPTLPDKSERDVTSKKGMTSYLTKYPRTMSESNEQPEKQKKDSIGRNENNSLAVKEEKETSGPSRDGFISSQMSEENGIIPKQRRRSSIAKKSKRGSHQLELLSSEDVSGSNVEKKRLSEERKSKRELRLISNDIADALNEPRDSSNRPSISSSVDNEEIPIRQNRLSRSIGSLEYIRKRRDSERRKSGISYQPEKEEVMQKMSPVVLRPDKDNKELESRRSNNDEDI